MGSVASRAAKFVRKSQEVTPVPYSYGKPATTAGNPRATVTKLNSGVLKGPTTKGHRN